MLDEFVVGTVESRIGSVRKSYGFCFEHGLCVVRLYNPRVCFGQKQRGILYM